MSGGAGSRPRRAARRAGAELQARCGRSLVPHGTHRLRPLRLRKSNSAFVAGGAGSGRPSMPTGRRGFLTLAAAR